MSYCNSKDKEKSRLNAVNEVLAGQSIAKTARRYGCYRSTVYYWLKRHQELKASHENTGETIKSIPAKSTRPLHSPNRISIGIEEAIVSLRRSSGRCAEVIHQELKRRGMKVSLSTVRRVLQRRHLTRYTAKYKRRRPHIDRPQANYPGALVEIDTVVCRHPITKQYSYVTSVVDVFSRMAYVSFHESNNCYEAFYALLKARNYFPFNIEMVQTDNGAEFGRSFQLEVNKLGIAYRHTRVRQPNDNAHVERFNRTLREECLGAYIPITETPNDTEMRLQQWLEYYNYRRIHMGLHVDGRMFCPAEFVNMFNY